MLIAFDIDDTIGDCTTPSLLYFNKKYGKSHTAASVAQWIREGYYDPFDDLFAKLYGRPTEEINEVFASEAEDIYQSMPVFPEALKELHRLVDEGHKLVYITARLEHWRKVTEWWLGVNEAPKGEVYFTCQKADLAVKLGVQRFYEDNIHNILSLRAVGVDCILVDSLQNDLVHLESVHRVYWNPYHLTIKQSLMKPDKGTIRVL